MPRLLPNRTADLQVCAWAGRRRSSRGALDEWRSSLYVQNQRASLKAVLPNCNSQSCVSGPLARCARVSPSRGGDYFYSPPHEGETTFILPLTRGRLLLFSPS